MIELAPIRVLLIDDHRLFRKAILTPLELEPRIDVVGTAPDGEFALHYCVNPDTVPDVILLDLNMPRIDGFELLLQVATLPTPIPRCLILTGDNTLASAVRAFSLGAAGYMLKDNITEESVVTALLAVAEGGIFVDDAIFAALMQSITPYANVDSGTLPDTLSTSDVEILADVAQGKENKEIALACGTTAKTISNRLSLIYTKIGVRNRVEAARFALRHGLADLDDNPS